jgi:endothelin-converting enzyme
MDPPSLQKYYESVNISSKILNNVLEVNKFAVAQMWAALGRPVDRGEWGLTAPAVNACKEPIALQIFYYTV